MQQINTFEETSFILQAGPVYDSPLYRVIYGNRKIVDSVYKSLPLSIRSQINNRIIDNTLNLAIKRKSPMLAETAAEYVRNLKSRTL